jgi:hypothetical protein
MAYANLYSGASLRGLDGKVCASITIWSNALRKRKASDCIEGGGGLLPEYVACTTSQKKEEEARRSPLQLHFTQQR